MKLNCAGLPHKVWWKGRAQFQLKMMIHVIRISAMYCIWTNQLCHFVQASLIQNCWVGICTCIASFHQSASCTVWWWWLLDTVNLNGRNIFQISKFFWYWLFRWSFIYWNLSFMIAFSAMYWKINSDFCYASDWEYKKKHK